MIENEAPSTVLCGRSRDRNEVPSMSFPSGSEFSCERLRDRKRCPIEVNKITIAFFCRFLLFFVVFCCFLLFFAAPLEEWGI